MPTPFEASTQSTFRASSLINNTRILFSELPDIRQNKTANNLKYAIADAA